MSSESTNSNAPEVKNLVGVVERHSECSICMAVLYNASSCVPCLHTFCVGCIVRWIERNNGKCPMCRVSVLDLSPNWVIRDLVDSYLQINPELQRSKQEKEELDKAELGYTVKWLGSTDHRMLHVESLASLRSAPESGDQKYAMMKTRAVELFKKILNSDGEEVRIEILKQCMDNLIRDVNKELFPAKVFLKYHRLEQAYLHMLRISIPTLGPDEHSLIGNRSFDSTLNEDIEAIFDEFEEGDEFDINMPLRIEETLSVMRRPLIKESPRALIDGFDPVDLEALARVQNMRRPRSLRFRVNEIPRGVYPPNSNTVPPRRHVTRRRSNQEALEIDGLLQDLRMMQAESTVPDTPAPYRPRRSARLAARNGEHPPQ